MINLGLVGTAVNMTTKEKVSQFVEINIGPCPKCKSRLIPDSHELDDEPVNVITGECYECGDTYVFNIGYVILSSP